MKKDMEKQDASIDAGADIARNLGLNSEARSGGRLKRWLLRSIPLLLVTLVGIRWALSSGADKLEYTTRPVSRGNITVTVSATGTLAPTNQVDIGSELSGTVETVAVDFNDHVRAGQVLARLDTSKIRAQVLQAKAALASARAKVLQTRATIAEDTKQLARLKEFRKLTNAKGVSQQDLDAAEAALQRAQADYAAAQAAVSQAQATLDACETDLSKTVIRSPINGIVLTRSVEPGQTVAASLQAPVLFTLAENLSKMDLNVDVDEADVGKVREGQAATFTVDAYPDKTFNAKITQVRYGSKTVEGVVTYQTVLSVDNSGLLLRPGMTATAEIAVQQRSDVVLIPNAALRFAPPAKEKPQQASGGIMSRLFPHPRRSTDRRPEASNGPNHRQRVWTLTEGRLTPIAVVTGATDGAMTELIKGDVAEGTALVIEASNG